MWRTPSWRSTLLVVGDVGLGGDDDDGDVGGFGGELEQAQLVFALKVGHQQVEEDQVGLLLAHGIIEAEALRGFLTS